MSFDPFVDLLTHAPFILSDHDLFVTNQFCSIVLKEASVHAWEIDRNN